MKIKIQVGSQYGKEIYYPVCDKAVIFSLMVGTKTLTKSTLKYIEQLGYEIDMEYPAPKGWRSDN